MLLDSDKKVDTNYHSDAALEPDFIIVKSEEIEMGSNESGHDDDVRM